MRTPASVKALAVTQYLKHLARTGDPIVIGPYRSEVGFEVLYWMPFVTWALKYAGIPADRCVALSRGGMGAFYPTKENADLYAAMGVDAVRLENTQDLNIRKLQKQTTVTQWDRDVVKALGAERFGKSQRVRMFHPSWMYWLLEEYWDERQTVQFAAPFLQFEPLPAPVMPQGLTLPEKFIAVRMYERSTLPLNHETRALLNDLVHRLADLQPVVLLRNRHHVDEHVDYPIAAHPRVQVLPDADAAQNLIVQAAVLSQCSAFVGTYGGVAQWALRYRKPSLSLYTQFGGTALAHWGLSQLLAARLGVPFQVMDLRLMLLWQKGILGFVEPTVPATA
jgi:hypothetical protein